MTINEHINAIADAFDVIGRHLRLLADEAVNNSGDVVETDNAALGMILKQYLTETHQTYRTFANKIGVTAGYVSMLVNNRNPKSGKPIRPTIETYNRIANAIGITASELLEQEKTYNSTRTWLQ